ncbi:MAG TPA: mechanosensitive ion channel family protein [Ignavibacteria bacterium]|nr:mechanosensitive ion channel family protein [Ignavibacteria bacterium]
MESEFISMADSFWKKFSGLIPEIFISLVIFIITIILARKLAGLIKKRLISRIDDELLANFITRISKWIITLIGVGICLNILGLTQFAGGLMAGAGVSAVVLGFAFKDIGVNFLSGVILAFNRPFIIGDVIESDGISGTIMSLDLRTTKIKTFDGIEIYVPNSNILNNPLSNFNAGGLRRFEYIVGIDYDADVSKARYHILEVLKEFEDIMDDPAPFVIVNELGANSINLKVFYWVNTDKAKESLLVIKGNAIERSLSSLKAGNVNIPFDSMQVQFNKGIPEIAVKVLNSDKNKS